MSFSVRDWLQTPEARADIAALEADGIKGVMMLEHIGVKLAEAVLEDFVPAPLRPLVMLLMPLVDKLDSALENLTEKEAKALLPFQATAQLGSRTLALSVAKVWPKDLPQSPFESLPDDPTQRNEE